MANKSLGSAFIAAALQEYPACLFSPLFWWAEESSRDLSLLVQG